jgi:hypothetical protein
MIINAYSIYDVKALTYSNPFFAINDATAIRIVTDAASDPNTSLGRHPADFILYRVGTFDGSNSALLGCDPRDHVVDIVALLHNRPQGDLFKQEA